MFANDKSIDNLEKSIDNLEALFKEIKKYIELQGQYIKLDLVEKLTILISTLILICVLIVLGMTALFYFSFMLVYTIDSFVNNIIASYAIIGGCILLLGIYTPPKNNFPANGKLSGKIIPRRQRQRRE